MKKNYQTPETLLVKIQPHKHLLFASATGDGTYNGGGDRGEFTGSQLSRRGGSWDDDED